MQRAIDQFSLAPLPIEMRFETTILATGTAFTWKRQSQHYVVTAWHNVSGRHPQTGEHLSANAAEPDRIWVHVNLKSPLGLGIKFPWEVPLRDGDGHPQW